MSLDEFPIISLVAMCDSNNEVGGENVTQAGSTFSTISAKQLKLHMIDATSIRKLGKAM